MRNSAPECPIVPRAKQATPSSNSGSTACPADGQPISQANRVPNSSVKNAHSLQSRKSSSHSSASSTKDSSRSLSQKGQHKTTTCQGQTPNKEVPVTTNRHASPTQSKAAGNSKQPSSNSRSKSPLAVSSKHGTSAIAKSASGRHPSGSSIGPSQANFGEYDDQEWDVGVGHLIIDLDADIAQADRGKMSSSSNNMNSSIEDKTSLKMKIKRTKPSTKTSEGKHVIVKSESTSVGTNALNQGVVSPAALQHNGSVVRPTTESGSSNRTPSKPRNIYKKEKRRPEVNGGAVKSSASVSSRTATVVNGPVSPVKESKPNSNNGTLPKKEYPKHGTPKSPLKAESPMPQSPSAGFQQNNFLSSDKTNDHDDITSQGPTKKMKLFEAKKDACVGTSVGTITEPDFLGPCEPGTGVILEGIVWNETEGGVLVVNVTWRGKSYVGTLLDCTKHDWAPPRLCDSPTSDMDARTPKGRGKRGRASAAAASTPGTVQEINVAETRSGKLRNAAKGRRGGSQTSSSTPNPPSSPVRPDSAGLKRKIGNKDESEVIKNSKRSRFSESSSPGPEQLNSLSENDFETVPFHRPPSPKLIQCPEPNCGKKYTHINGLKYHQTHVHKESTLREESDIKERKLEQMSTSPLTVIENLVDINTTNQLKPSHPVEKVSSFKEEPTNEARSECPIENIKDNCVPVIMDATDTINYNDMECDDIKPEPTNEEPPATLLIVPTEKLLNQSLSSALPEALLNKLPQVQEPHQNYTPTASGTQVQNSSLLSSEAVIKEESSPLSNHITDSSKSASPVGLVGNPESSLPVVPAISDRNSFSEQKLSQKEDVNSVSINDDENSLVRETRSPAYSDISEANDPVPSNDIDSKDFKDDKKLDMSLPDASQYAYDLYFNSRGQPQPQYMMPMQQQLSSGISKSAESAEMKGKEEPHGNSDYSKIPPHYLYHFSQIYNSDFPNHYMRENIYSDDEKPKVEIKECPMEDTEKGPTDLSRSSHNPGTSRDFGQSAKSLFNSKDIKSESSVIKDLDCKVPILDKRHPTDFRYGGPYDSRGTRLPSPHATSIASSSLQSPHHPRTVSPAVSKENKCDKGPDAKLEGVKPTMETTGPPPAPTTSAYYPPFGYPQLTFDPYRPPIMPGLSLPSGFPPYTITGHPSLGGMRYPMVPSGPEDLSRNTLPHNFYGNPHKLSELQDRMQKSPSALQSGLPCVLPKGNSPMSFASTEARLHHAALLSTSSPSLPNSSNIPITSIAPLQHVAAERKLLPHMALPEGYPYNILTGPQFSPHFPPLGLNPVGLGVPPAMTTAHLPK